MGRWSQYDELEYHIPGVGKRIGYDADTGVTYYSGGYRSLPWQPSVVVSNRPRENALPETLFAEDDDPNDVLALDIRPFTESQPRSGSSTGTKKKKSIIVQSTPPSQSPAHDDLDIPSSLSTVETVDGSLCIVSSSSSARAETEFSTTSSIGPKLLKKPPPARSKTLNLSRPPPPPYSKLDPIAESSQLRLGDAPRHSRGTPPRRGVPPSQASQLQSNNPSESRGVTIKRALTLPPLRLPGSTLDLGWSSDGTPQQESTTHTSTVRPTSLAACRCRNANKDLPPLPEFDV